MLCVGIKECHLARIRHAHTSPPIPHHLRTVVRMKITSEGGHHICPAWTALCPAWTEFAQPGQMRSRLGKCGQMRSKLKATAGTVVLYHLSSSSIAPRILLLGDRCLLLLRKPSARSGVAVVGGGDAVGLADDCACGDGGKDGGVSSIELRSYHGALFSITLSSHGYTFVGKGTVEAFVSDLRHEGHIYERLKSEQGRAVPVYLGNMDLNRTY